MYLFMYYDFLKLLRGYRIKKEGDKRTYKRQEFITFV